MRTRNVVATIFVLFVGVSCISESAFAFRGRGPRPFARVLFAPVRAAAFVTGVAIRGTARVAAGTVRLGAAAVRGTARIAVAPVRLAARGIRNARRGVPPRPVPGPRAASFAFGPHDGSPGPGPGPLEARQRPIDQGEFPSNANFRVNLGRGSCLATFLGQEGDAGNCGAIVPSDCLETFEGTNASVFGAGSNLGNASLVNRTVERTAVLGGSARIQFACSADEAAESTPVSLDLALEFQRS